MLTPDQELSLTEKKLPLAVSNETVALYVKHNPGTEIQLPYSEPLKGTRNPLQAWSRTEHKGLLLGSQPALLATIILSNVLYIMLAIVIVEVCRAFSVAEFMSTFPATIVTMFLLLTGSYAAVNYLNFRLAYGGDWLHALLGPTHLGLSRESLKLCWLGRFFSSHSLIVSWNEILSLDAYRWSLTDGRLAPKIRIRHQQSITRESPTSSFEIDLSGFQDAEQCRVFMEELNRNVADDRKTDLFKKLFRDLDPLIAKLPFANSITEEPLPHLVSRSE